MQKKSGRRTPNGNIVEHQKSGAGTFVPLFHSEAFHITIASLVTWSILRVNVIQDDKRDVASEMKSEGAATKSLTIGGEERGEKEESEALEGMVKKFFYFAMLDVFVQEYQSLEKEQMDQTEDKGYSRVGRRYPSS